VKCPRCHSICADNDRACYSCEAPLRVSSSGGSPLAGRLATLFACLGACIAPMYANAPSRPSAGINWTKVHYAGLGGAVGGALGFFVGSLFRTREPQQ
jgi:hypothetical protein